MWFGNGSRPHNNLAGYSRSFGSTAEQSNQMTVTTPMRDFKLDWTSVVIGAVGICLIWGIMNKK